MKKYIAYIGIFTSILFFSCTSILDKEPYDSIPEQNVWSSLERSNLYLNNLYNLTLPSFSASTTSGMSDETTGSDSNNDYMYGRLTEESVGDFSNDTYSKIRKINILLERIETGGITDQTGINRIKGQAYFLRAWTYWNLVNLYGGVPMITSTQSMSTSGEVPEEIKVRRNKTSECIDTIVRDLNLAAQYLPSSWDASNYGRITRGAALALKGRVLLFWASPQFNKFDKIDRWERAYNANLAARDTLLMDGYGLYPSFKELFIDCKEQTSEAIFVRVYDAAIAGSYYHSYDNGARPAVESMGGSGGTNNPTWELVKAFPMANGFPIEDTINSGYNRRGTRYWNNRDPRFYYTIAYNTDRDWPLSGNLNYRVWTYHYLKDGTLISTETKSKSKTGFYCKKFINPNIKSENTSQVGTDWMEIRFTEVLLNLAECANELGDGDASKKTEAVGYISQIRGRSDVNIPLGNINDGMSVKDLREYIIRERQIELAFENKRHWDMRRRNMFAEDLGNHTPKLNERVRNAWLEQRNTTSLQESDFLNMRDTMTFSDNDSYTEYFYPGVEEALDTRSVIDYQQPKYNFYAIPQTNLDKNPNLEQTNTWGGSFDPYEE